MMETQDELGRLLDMAREFRFAMLVTIAEDGHLHGRPMTVAEIDDEAGAIWFVTSRTRESTSEIAHDSRAIVTMQGKDAYVQWSGRASLVDDSMRLHEVWKPSFASWFPNGPDDASIVLVRVDVEIGEYWDQSGGLKVRAMLRRAKSALQGQDVDEESAREEDQKVHGRVRVANGHRRDA
ncbi:MAG: pyridoxamine 5'-phosphate oxidase family protein [Myxococcota bacterium]|nr:pyridoxamine 5'-phosphate oxidase family protein [Myxococcota bacterium]